MIHIAIRRTIDWQDEELFYRQLDERLIHKVRTWNETFDMPYHVFRYHLKEIAQENLAAVQDSVLSEGFGDVPRDALVVPIDDDDWLAPNLAERLEAAIQPGITGLYWHRDFIERPLTPVSTTSLFVKTKLLGRPRLKWTCSTNNYAFVNSGPESNALNGHMGASRFFDDHPDQVRFIDEHLSVMNRSMASTTTLIQKKRQVSPRFLRRNHRLFSGLYRNLDLSRWPWAAAPVARMIDLMSEVRPR